MGDSRGRCEGNTLVVETTNFNDRGWITNNGASGRLRGVPVSEALKVTERFTRVSQDLINYEFAVEDPNVYDAAVEGGDAAQSRPELSDSRSTPATKGTMRWSAR